MSTQDPRDPALRAEAMEDLLRERGLVSSDAIDTVIQHYEEDLGPMNGAKIVSRAWLDAGFRSRLLDDATTATQKITPQ